MEGAGGRDLVGRSSIRARFKSPPSPHAAEAREKKGPSFARIGRLKPAPTRQVTGERATRPLAGEVESRWACQGCAVWRRTPPRARARYTEHSPASPGPPPRHRSEERRVGKECRSRWS